jgi:hypothetical protein
MDDATIAPAADQTAAAAVHTALAPHEAAAAPDERETLRRLAERVAGLAHAPATAEKRALWTAHNSLGRTRPVIYCDPENGWNEIIAPADLACRGKLARSWEMHLRREIFYGGRMGDDKPVEPVFDVAYVTSADDWGMEETYTKTEDAGSYVWKGPLSDYARDLPRLHEPRFSIDRETTAACLDLAGRIFGGVLDVRLKSAWWWSMGLTYPAARLRGLDQLFFDFIDHPDELKQLLAAISRGYLAKLDRLEAEGLLSPNWDGTYVGSGGLGYTTELPGPGYKGKVRTKDLWGFTESQETVNISPEMYEEFIFPNERPIMERFGLTCYGCCEPVHGRWHVIKRHHNLRRVSVSPWADVEKMADWLQDRYILSLKPNPAVLATPTIHHDAIRAGLRKTFETTRGCVVEAIMKDNHTIGRNPQNVIDWCRIAREEADRAGH